MIEGVQLSTFQLLMVVCVTLIKYAFGANVFLRVRKATTLDLMLLCMVVGVSGQHFLAAQGLVVEVYNIKHDNAIGQNQVMVVGFALAETTVCNYAIIWYASNLGLLSLHVKKTKHVVQF
jgi:hypothetical protein